MTRTYIYKNAYAEYEIKTGQPADSSNPVYVHMHPTGAVISMKLVKKLDIPFEQLTQAYTNYRIITHAPSNKNVLRQFFMFLGLPENIEEIVAVNDLQHIQGCEEAKVRVEWMAGPHADILYKAYQARQRGSG